MTNQEIIVLLIKIGEQIDSGGGVGGLAAIKGLQSY